MGASKPGKCALYRFSIGLLLAVSVCSPVLPIPVEPSGDTVRYDFPQILALELVAVGVSAGKRHIRGTLEPRIGAPQQMAVHFAAAPGWRVTPDRVELPGLGASRSQEILACLEPASGSATLDCPWVMMRVSYLPDYLALLKVIKDSRRYPDPIERSRLLGIVRRNFQAKARQTDGMRLDFDLVPPPAAEDKGVQP